MRSVSGFEVPTLSGVEVRSLSGVEVPTLIELVKLQIHCPLARRPLIQVLWFGAG